MQPIDLPGQNLAPDDRDERWDGASVHAFEGTYGDYLLAKAFTVGARGTAVATWDGMLRFFPPTRRRRMKWTGKRTNHKKRVATMVLAALATGRGWAGSAGKPRRSCLRSRYARAAVETTVPALSKATMLPLKHGRAWFPLALPAGAVPPAGSLQSRRPHLKKPSRSP